jgi:hypothetical protein
MKQTQVLGSLLVVVLACAVFGCAVGISQPCTPATCEGPVIAYFDEEDCTGDITFFEMDIEFGVCHQSRLYEKNEVGLYTYSFYGSICDSSSSNASYQLQFERWGACQPNLVARRGLGLGRQEQVQMAAAAIMVLASVNDSFVAPQTFDNQPLQAFEDGYTTCYSPDNCTLPDGQAAVAWETGYPTVNVCDEPQASYVNTKLNIGVCQNYYNKTYSKSGCFESKGSFYAFYRDSACTDPFYARAYRYSCLTSATEVHCNAPFTPIPSLEPASPPSNNASSTQFSTLLLMIALIVLASI